MDNILAAKQILESCDVHIPKDNQRVYKDECLYSYDSPVSIIIIILLVHTCILFFTIYTKKSKK